MNLARTTDDDVHDPYGRAEREGFNAPKSIA